MREDDVHSVPSSPTTQPHSNHSKTTTPAARTSRRRHSRGNRNAVEEEDVKNGDEDHATPSKSGIRSSGRQRKVPKRYMEELDETPQSTKRTATPTKSAGNTRSVRKHRAVSEVEEADRDSPVPRRDTLTRTRSKRTPVRFDTRDQPNDEDGPSDYNARSSSEPDGVEDIVSMQLQQDLLQRDEEKDAAPAETVPGYVEQFQALIRQGLRSELGVLTQFVLEKLNGKKPIPLKGLDVEYQKAHHLIEQTVTAGEGNSMLLLGSRGCGKTAIVETSIASLAREHGNDFHVVRLNGFLHTDDRLALREMWRQLGRETNTEEEAGKVSTYADTMATLLALLSHPEELSGPSGSNAVTAAKSVVIILDEFDLFVSHPRQTLLYNLFDIAQARKAPVAVIGLTTKVDVTEMLEKRVKSRFSHRYVFVPLPKSLDTFSEICYAGLDVEESELTELLSNSDSRSATNWQTLLQGWRTYLKVCHSHCLESYLPSRACGTTRHFNSISRRYSIRQSPSKSSSPAD